MTKKIDLHAPVWRCPWCEPPRWFSREPFRYVEPALGQVPSDGICDVCVPKVLRAAVIAGELPPKLPARGQSFHRAVSTDDGRTHQPEPVVPAGSRAVD